MGINLALILTLLTLLTGIVVAMEKFVWRTSQKKSASLGLLTLVLVGLVGGTLWQQRAQRAVADEPSAEPVEAPPVVVEQDAQVADVGTDALVAEPIVIEEVLEEEPVVEEPPPVEPSPKATPKKKKRKKKPVAKTAAAAVPAAETAAVSAPVSETAPESETEKGNETDPAVESDDGIDWTVPDFPDEAAPPTGTPDARPRNPVVIDEPPPPGSAP